MKSKIAKILLHCSLLFAVNTHAASNVNCSIQNTTSVRAGNLLRGNYVLNDNGHTILNKELPLSTKFSKDYIDDCLVKNKYTYVIQELVTKDDVARSIYLHQIDFKGRIINSIEPFKVYSYCSTGKLNIEGDKIGLSAFCKQQDITTKVEQLFTGTLKPLTNYKARALTSITALEVPLTLKGTVVGPIILTEKNNGADFKAFYLKTPQSFVIKDNGECGEQIENEFAIEAFDMQKYVNQSVAITGKIHCQQERTGRYHIFDVKHIQISK